MGSSVDTHSVIAPAILYWGTPVVIISSENEDGTSNIAPMSSAFWLGDRCMLGLAASSQTPKNMLSRRQCVLNLPEGTDDMVAHVNGLACTTGTEVVPPGKIDRGYSYVKDKWAHSNLTPQASDLVRPARVKECAVQMECEVVGSHDVFQDIPDRTGVIVAIEVKVVRVHVLERLRMKGYANRVDPDKWQPMIMNFQELYGVKEKKLGGSVLGEIPEEKYRGLNDLKTPSL